MEEKFLVTGAAGFIGFHLSKRLLNEGIGVVGLDNFNTFASNLGPGNIISCGLDLRESNLYDRSEEIAGDFDNTKFSFLPFFSIQLFLLIFIFLPFLPFKNIYEGNLDLVFIVSFLQILFIFIQTVFQKELKFTQYYISEYLRLFIYLIYQFKFSIAL